MREPAFAVAAILMIGTGVGVSTAIFTVVNGVLLRPLAVPDPDRLLAVHRNDDREADLSQPDAVDIRRDVRSRAAFGVVTA